jgi:hypothetical protein
MWGRPPPLSAERSKGDNSLPLERVQFAAAVEVVADDNPGVAVEEMPAFEGVRCLRK